MTIFVSVAAYRDPELFPTIQDAYNKAKNPQDLRFGILDQSESDGYDLLPTWRDQIRYVWIKDRDARGVGFARSVIQGMVDSEDYLLQIDSHMRFDINWDEILIDQMSQLPWKSILTASPMPWDADTGPRFLKKGKTIQLLPHKDYPLRNTANIVDWDSKYGFVKGERLAAGFLFSRGCLYDHLPYDHHLYFNGEEYTYAKRALCAGWCIFHPKYIPVYHLYKSAGQPSDQVHWNKNVDRYWDPSLLRIKGEKRIESVMKGASGVYSIPSSQRDPHDLPPSATLAPRPFCLDFSKSAPNELWPLFQNLFEIIYGRFSLLSTGRHSLTVQKIDFGQNSYVLKASTFDPLRERAVTSANLCPSILLRGSSYYSPALIIDILTSHGHYLLYEHLEFTDLRSRSYREALDEILIVKGIGEFNARNRNRDITQFIPRKRFDFSLSYSRLRRRFNTVDNDLLKQSFMRAQQVSQSLISRIAIHEDYYYSISHNDMHRGNMSIGLSGKAQGKAIFLDYSRLCWAPLGNDLQFFIYYLLRSWPGEEKLKDIIQQYLDGIFLADSSLEISYETVLNGAMFGYIHKWLNIHRRPVSPHDWKIFNLCLDVAELFLCSNAEDFLSGLSSTLDTDAME